MVEDVFCLVLVPGGMSMELAALLPTGGLWAYKTVMTIQSLIAESRYLDKGWFLKS